jgi:hypothetical protein
MNKTEGEISSYSSHDDMKEPELNTEKVCKITSLEFYNEKSNWEELHQTCNM